MFKDTSQGITHHDKDACHKCKICNAHFYRDIISQHACVTKEILKEWEDEIDHSYSEFSEVGDNIDPTK